MASFAPVASLPMLEQLYEAHLLGGYHLLLAHEVLENKSRWAAFYKRQRQFLAPDPLIIMDNSLVELGKPLAAEQLIEATNIVKASVIVLPDVLRSCKETLDLSVSAYEQLCSYLPENCKLMGVVQGDTPEEILDCADQLIRYAHANVLAVPRVTTEVLGSRIFIATQIAEQFNGIGIHMLGFSNNISDDIAATVTCPTCLGIDGSVPLRMGCRGLLMNTVHALTSFDEPRPPDWLDINSNYPVTFEVMDNIRRLRQAIT